MSRIYFRKSVLVIALAALVAACADRQTTSESPALPRDLHSYAQPEKARVTHVSLDLAPDFTAHKLSGTAKLSIERGQGADSIVLDSSNLTIKRVSDGTGAALVFNTGAAKEFIGAPLTVTLPTQGDTIVIEYETSPTASAVQWLSPEQTAGKKLPFLFTQGEAILTRSWVPTQDSPGIRQTYDATIRVPAGMHAVMSADHVQPEGEKDSLGRAVFRFKLDKPIPISFRPRHWRYRVQADRKEHGCVR
jgi:aminopeptidase N